MTGDTAGVGFKLKGVSGLLALTYSKSDKREAGRVVMMEPGAGVLCIGVVWNVFVNLPDESLSLVLKWLSSVWFSSVPMCLGSWGLIM